MRDHVVSGLTDGELDHARRELTASLALSRSGSPVRTPIQAQLTAINAEIASRTTSAPTAGRTAGAPTASAVGQCSCGFATSDDEWLACHLLYNPEHREVHSYGNRDGGGDGERQPCAVQSRGPR